MTAWIRGATLPEAEFAARFFGRSADDPVVRKLREAAVDMGPATSHADLRSASEQLADAMQAVGFDRWPRFLAEAQDRARAKATVASIKNNGEQQNTAKDAIRPVYPIETAIGAAAAAATGGIAGALGVLGGAIVRQVVPERPSAPGEQAQPASDASANPRGLPPAHVKPPVKNPSKLKLGPASRPSEAAKGG